MKGNTGRILAKMTGRRFNPDSLFVQETLPSRICGGVTSMIFLDAAT